MDTIKLTHIVPSGNNEINPTVKWYYALSQVAEDVPRIEVEELLLSEDKPEEDRYDPNEWDTVEKITPSGEKKKYLIRIKVTRVVKLHMKPSQVDAVDGDEEFPHEVIK